MAAAHEVLLAVDEVTVSFGSGRRRLTAVDAVSLELGRREVLGLIGETGSGKTTLLRAIAGLVPIAKGRVLFQQSAPDEHPSKGKALQVVFQDPLLSLNPKMPVWKSVAEPLVPKAWRIKDDLRPRSVELLRLAGLGPELADRLPAEMSGGQRQRVTIARALASSTPLLLLDEPVAALDVSLQAEILDLLERLRSERELAYLIISHDLGAVARLADRIAVMYAGRLVEVGPTRRILEDPRHPYSQALISAIPRVRRRGRRRVVLQGELPDPRRPPSGCRFRSRCPYAIDRCAEETPAIRPVTGGDGGDMAACHRMTELRAR